MESALPPFLNHLTDYREKCSKLLSNTIKLSYESIDIARDIKIIRVSPIGV